MGFVIILNTDGSTNVIQTFGDPLSGVFDPIFVQSVAVDSLGNIILAGKFSGQINVNPGVDNTLTAPAVLATPDRR